MELGDPGRRGHTGGRGSQRVRGHGTAVDAEEKGVNPRMGWLHPKVIRVMDQSPLAGHPEAHDPFLVALSQDLDVPVLDVDVLVLEGDRLGEA